MEKGAQQISPNRPVFKQNVRRAWRNLRGKKSADEPKTFKTYIHFK